MAQLLQRLGVLVAIPTPQGDPYVLVGRLEEKYGEARAVRMAKCVIFSFDPSLREMHMPPNASAGNRTRVTLMATMYSAPGPLMLLLELIRFTSLCTTHEVVQMHSSVAARSQAFLQGSGIGAETNLVARI